MLFKKIILTLLTNFAVITASNEPIEEVFQTRTLSSDIASDEPRLAHHAVVNIREEANDQARRSNEILMHQTITSTEGTSATSVTDPGVLAFLRRLKTEHVISAAESRANEIDRYSRRSKFFETLSAISAAAGKTASGVGTGITAALATSKPDLTGEVSSYFLAAAGTCTALYCGFKLMSDYYAKKTVNSEKNLRDIMEQQARITNVPTTFVPNVEVVTHH